MREKSGNEEEVKVQGVEEEKYNRRNGGNHREDS